MRSGGSRPRVPPRMSGSLRLVQDEVLAVEHPRGAEREVGRHRPSAADRAHRAITQANVESAYATDLDPQDPRWLVAVETAARLEGSLLSFERRQQVLAFAARVGVRTFDANLIIAAVQDRARRGEPLASTMGTIAHTAAPRANAPSATPDAHASAGNDRWLYLTTALVAIAIHALLGWALLRIAFG